MRKNSSMRPHKKHSRKAFFIFTAFLLVSLIGVAFAYRFVRALPNPNRIKERSVVESTKIYDRTGTILLYEIHGEEKRTVVPLAEIPMVVRNATLATEDVHFYEHAGLEWRGILRALFTNIREGDITQGGSTITQQLIKNSILSGERTLQRKIKEALLSLLLERQYSKDEIFELYLNQIPYGSNAYGIESAAQTFFAKPAREVTLGEAALLAALPKAPTYYSPYGSRKDALLERRNWILDRMAEVGFATKEDTAQAKKIPLAFAASKQSIRAPHFVMFIREYLDEKYGAAFIENGGLKVITTLDWKLQEEAEKIVKEGAEKNEALVQAANAALVAIDPKTGDILSLVGSQNYWGKPFPNGCRPGVNCRFDPHVNVATRSRQPGSAFKPFVYATALKKGYTPETVLFDVPTEFNASCNPDGTPGSLIDDKKECYHPQNYDGKFRGPVSIRQALAQSLNLPSVKLLYLAGVPESIETARAMGITTVEDPARYGLTLVLGGAEVTLLQMASAYGVFATDGILHPPFGILKIENSNGLILEEKKDSSLPVLDTEIARTMNDLLSDNGARVPVFSPQSSLYFPNRRVAAKTGTTQEYRDAWVMGYTPSLVVGVWVGNNDNTAMHQGGLSVMVAGPLWHQFLEFALAGLPPEEFTLPEKKEASGKPIFRGLYRSGDPIRIDKISKKLATDLTPPELIEEVNWGKVQSILASIKKDDPLGLAPENGLFDSQLKNWQAGIDSWLAANALTEFAPPKEFDDVHTIEKKPKIIFLQPQKNTEVNILREIIITIQTVFPLREVSLFIDEELVDSKTAPIIVSELHFPLVDALTAGKHQIKITAYDAVQNRETVESTISVLGE